MDNRPRQELRFEGAIFGGEPPTPSPGPERAFQVGENTPLHRIKEACIGNCGLIRTVPEWARDTLLEEVATKLDAQNLGQTLHCPGPLPWAGGHFRCQQPGNVKDILQQTGREITRGWAEPTHPEPPMQEQEATMSEGQKPGPE